MRQKVLFLLAKLVASQLLLLLGHNLAVQVEQQNILAAQICRRSTVAWFSGVSTRFLLLQYDDDDNDGSAKMPLLHKQTNKQTRIRGSGLNEDTHSHAAVCKVCCCC